jgi:hypothetical protein
LIVEPKQPKNTRLESIFHSRYKTKLNELKTKYSNDQDLLQESLLDREDLLKDMYLLSNYDFCNNNHEIRTTSTKKRKKTKKTKQNNVILKDKTPKTDKNIIEEGELDDETDLNKPFKHEIPKEKPNESKSDEVKRKSQNVYNSKQDEPLYRPQSSRSRERSHLKRSRTSKTRSRSRNRRRTRSRSNSSHRHYSKHSSSKNYRDRSNRSGSRSRNNYKNNYNNRQHHGHSSRSRKDEKCSKRKRY